MDASIFFSLYIVVDNDAAESAVFSLPRDLQTR